MCTIDWTATAAWVQAIGSIFAIIAAIWIGYNSDRRARDLVIEERERQARIGASAVAAKIGNVALETSAKIRHLLRLRDDAAPGPVEIKYQDSFRRLFQIETRVEAVRAQVLLFDSDSGVLAGTVLDTVEGHNHSVDLALESFLKMDCTGEHLVRLSNDVADRFKFIAAQAAEIERRLEERYDLSAKQES